MKEERRRRSMAAAVRGKVKVTDDSRRRHSARTVEARAAPVSTWLYKDRIRWASCRNKKDQSWSGHRLDVIMLMNETLNTIFKQYDTKVLIMLF